MSTVNQRQFAVPSVELASDEEDVDWDEALGAGDAGSSQSSSYAGSAVSESPADIADHLHNQPLVHMQQLAQRVEQAFDPTPLDHAVAVQAQTSGMVHGKTLELEQVRAQAVERLQETRAKLNQGLRVAQTLVSDLEWTQKRLSYISRKAKARFPIEYAQANDKYRQGY